MRRASKSPHVNVQQAGVQPSYLTDTTIQVAHPPTLSPSSTAKRSASPRPTSTRSSFASSAVTKEHLNQKPWRYLGYRGFSTFVASDDDFFILRRFGNLHARILLALQDQITVLESNLRAIDEDASRDDDDYHNGTFREDRFQERVVTIAEIQKKLGQFSEWNNLSCCKSEHLCCFSPARGSPSMNTLWRAKTGLWKLSYTDKLVLQHSQLRARPEVPKEDVLSVVRWLENKETAIAEEEVEYITHTSDLFQLVSKNKSFLRRFLERSDRFRTFPVWRRPSPGLCEDAIVEDEHVHYHDDAKINHAVAVIILTLGVSMIISPLWVLEFVHGSTKRLGIITLFIVLFVTLLSVTTVAKPFESLAAAAAYSAVLMVFLQIAPGG